ncbi:MAG: hypothetical protein Ta2G_02510 [Termitinemataceae bacterium]|nr:MAG: hypothetical protein Ta2G_02510 [Termitinemataceae bacterium]
MEIIEKQELSDLKGGSSLLEHFEKIVELSGGKGFSETFWNKAKQHLDCASNTMRISTTQAAIFAHFLNRCDDQMIRMEDIADSIKCNRIKLLRYMDDIDELEKRKLLRCCKQVSGYTGKENGMPTYRVPSDVIRSIRNGKIYKPASYKNISFDKFFCEIGDLFQQRINAELSYNSLVDELRDLSNDNPQLSITQKIKCYKLISDSVITLIRFCDLYVNNNDDNVGMHDIDDIFETPWDFRIIRQSLQDGSHDLMQLGLLEFANNDGYSDTEHFHLTDKAKSEFLLEFDLKQRNSNRGKDFLFAKNISEKKLFYNKKESSQIEQLTTLLSLKKFSSIRDKLKQRGMRGGFACLFYGAPGTGKTETVYQIARTTGRDILAVDISETKSHWFGDSEKAVKQIFDRYRGVVKSGDLAPILLFNEADAVIGKRTSIGTANASTDKTLNAIQNIILQEIETLEGIMIATTNFENNMDAAFERRFLYKIKFEKPETDSRASIWQSIIPELSVSDASVLATRFNFSGGQIENIARKRTVECIISDDVPTLDTLIKFCCEESLVKEESRIGFGV